MTDQETRLILELRKRRVKVSRMLGKTPELQKTLGRAKVRLNQERSLYPQRDQQSPILQRNRGREGLKRRLEILMMYRKQRKIPQLFRNL